MKHIFDTTKGYRFLFVALFFSVISATVTGSLFPFCIGKIVDQIFYERQVKGFLVSFLVYAGLYFLNQCAHGALNYLWAHLEITYVVSIRKRCFQHLLKLKAGIWTQIRSGDVMKRIQDDTECYLEFIHRSLFYVPANVVQLVLAIGYLIYTDVLLGLAAVAMMLVMAYSVRYFTARLKERHRKLRAEKGLVGAWILEMMTGIAQWKLLNADQKVKRDYRAKTGNVIREEVDTGYLVLKSEKINQALALMGQLFVYCIAASCIRRESMTAGQFVSCAAYFSTCAACYNALCNKLANTGSHLAGIERVKEFLEWEEEQDLPGAVDSSIEKGCIRFENVSFAYDDETVLRNLDIEINAGEKVAFVGKSGEGKSTLLQLLCRFYKPASGQILLDGRPLAAYTLSSLRRQLAVVQQENGLFQGSLRRNIIFSDDRSQDGRVWEILEGLKLKEAVEELPEGLDAAAESLSGGQKQRIAIARCIYRRPKILLLDEATSALDEETEAAVNSFLYGQLAHTTILTVAHRFAAVLAAEKCVVIDQGQVTGVGKHEDLLRSNERYRQLYEAYQNSPQNKGEA
ncbi:MAG: ABC transporter ATP-binding protein/permease [Lachnospiraceae bacterium]|nr:ABC transporter ATP-binding protein/permease [Lachnospiraceae bacterium]